MVSTAQGKPAFRLKTTVDKWGKHVIWWDLTDACSLIHFQLQWSFTYSILSDSVSTKLNSWMLQESLYHTKIPRSWVTTFFFTRRRCLLTIWWNIEHNKKRGKNWTNFCSVTEIFMGRKTRIIDGFNGRMLNDVPLCFEFGMTRSMSYIDVINYLPTGSCFGGLSELQEDQYVCLMLDLTYKHV